MYNDPIALTAHKTQVSKHFTRDETFTGFSERHDGKTQTTSDAVKSRNRRAGQGAHHTRKKQFSPDRTPVTLLNILQLPRNVAHERLQVIIGPRVLLTTN